MKALLRMNDIKGTMNKVIKLVKQALNKALAGFRATFNSVMSLCNRIPYPLTPSCPSWPALAAIAEEATEASAEAAMTEYPNMPKLSLRFKNSHPVRYWDEELIETADSTAQLRAIKSNIVHMLRAHAPLYFKVNDSITSLHCYCITTT
jgi:hypothetical protein